MQAPPVSLTDAVPNDLLASSIFPRLDARTITSLAAASAALRATAHAYARLQVGCIHTPIFSYFVYIRDPWFT